MKGLKFTKSLFLIIMKQSITHSFTSVESMNPLTFSTKIEDILAHPILDAINDFYAS